MVSARLTFYGWLSFVHLFRTFCPDWFVIFYKCTKHVVTTGSRTLRKAQELRRTPKGVCVLLLPTLSHFHSSNHTAQQNYYSLLTMESVAQPVRISPETFTRIRHAFAFMGHLAPNNIAVDRAYEFLRRDILVTDPRFLPGIHESPLVGQLALMLHHFQTNKLPPYEYTPPIFSLKPFILSLANPYAWQPELLYVAMIDGGEGGEYLYCVYHMPSRPRSAFFAYCPIEDLPEQLLPFLITIPAFGFNRPGEPMHGIWWDARNGRVVAPADVLTTFVSLLRGDLLEGSAPAL
jgi:hypothetical protein